MKIALNSSDGRFELLFSSRPNQGTNLECRFDLGSWSTDMSRGEFCLETDDQLVQLTEDILSCLTEIQSKIILNECCSDEVHEIRTYLKITSLSKPPLIVDSDKKWLKFDFQNEPNISFSFLFLLDITIVDAFEEDIREF